MSFPRRPGISGSLQPDSKVFDTLSGHDFHSMIPDVNQLSFLRRRQSAVYFVKEIERHSTPGGKPIMIASLGVVE